MEDRNPGTGCPRRPLRGIRCKLCQIFLCHIICVSRIADKCDLIPGIYNESAQFFRIFAQKGIYIPNPIINIVRLNLIRKFPECFYTCLIRFVIPGIQTAVHFCAHVIAVNVDNRKKAFLAFLCYHIVQKPAPHCLPGNLVFRLSLFVPPKLPIFCTITIPDRLFILFELSIFFILFLALIRHLLLTVSDLLKLC